MKVYSQNNVYNQRTPECFTCSGSLFKWVPTVNLVLVQCAFKGKCDLKNLHDNKIFKL
jgi:hypothetical protein